MRCYREILRISYQDLVTKEEVRARIQQAVGPYEHLTIVKRSTLKRSPVHQVWPKLSCKAQWKGEEDKVGRQHQGMDRPGVRQVPEKNGGNCLWSRLWRPNDPRGYWAGEGEEEVLKVRCSIKDKDGDGFYLPDFGVCLVLSLPFCLTPGFWLACR